MLSGFQLTSQVNAHIMSTTMLPQMLKCDFQSLFHDTRGNPIEEKFLILPSGDKS